MSNTINLDLPERYWEALRSPGVSRDGENSKALVFHLSRGYSNKEMAWMHDALSTALATALPAPTASHEPTPDMVVLLHRLIKWDTDFPVNSYNGYAGLKELDAIIADARLLVATPARTTVASNSAVCVEKLDWEEVCDEDGVEFTEALPYRYEIFDKAVDVETLGVQVAFNASILGFYPTVMEAKAAAKTHFANQSAIHESWLPIDTADKTFEMRVSLLNIPIVHTFAIWVRCEGGDPFKASWCQKDSGSDQGYWWHWDADDVVDPDEWMPHPLGLLAAVKRAERQASR